MKSEEQLPKKTWANAQDYELRHAIGFMQEDHFQNLFAQFKRGDLMMSKGQVNPLILKEFFSNDFGVWQRFADFVTGKRCMDIGPCVFSPLATWDLCGERIAVEPLGAPIVEWQRANLGMSAFDNLALECCGGDEFIPKYEGRIDGAIYCRNMLDHTPNWPFVLGNISSYAAPGCYLLLWSDLHHHGTADDGHFDITESIDAFRRLIKSLGFEIEREFKVGRVQETEYGCVARRI